MNMMNKHNAEVNKKYNGDGVYLSLGDFNGVVLLRYSIKFRKGFSLSLHIILFLKSFVFHDLRLK